MQRRKPGERARWGARQRQAVMASVAVSGVGVDGSWRLCIQIPAARAAILLFGAVVSEFRR